MEGGVGQAKGKSALTVPVITSSWGRIFPVPLVTPIFRQPISWTVAFPPVGDLSTIPEHFQECAVVLGHDSSLIPGHFDCPGMFVQSAVCCLSS